VPTALTLHFVRSFLGSPNAFGLAANVQTSSDYAPGVVLFFEGGRLLGVDFASGLFRLDLPGKKLEDFLGKRFEAVYLSTSGAFLTSGGFDSPSRPGLELYGQAVVIRGVLTLDITARFPSTSDLNSLPSSLDFWEGEQYLGSAVVSGRFAHFYLPYSRQWLSDPRAGVLADAGTINASFSLVVHLSNGFTPTELFLADNAIEELFVS
jgi:hypothetical protein